MLQLLPGRLHGQNEIAFNTALNRWARFRITHAFGLSGKRWAIILFMRVEPIVPPKHGRAA